MKTDNKIKDKSGISFSALYRYIALAIVIWALLIAGSLAWGIHNENKNAIELAKNEARVVFNKDLAFRTWAASHGGVYVPPDERTPPNPYLSHIPDRDVTTTTGKSLTLMNPAYLLRQVMEDYESLYGVRGHITSLKLLNPINAPDEWERNTLMAFEQGADEKTELTSIDGVPYMRLMAPLVTEEACLKCHGYQGHKVGDVRGGVSVAVPMATYSAIMHADIFTQLGTHGTIFLLGLGGIGFVYIRTSNVLLNAIERRKNYKERMQRWKGK